MGLLEHVLDLIYFSVKCRSAMLNSIMHPNLYFQARSNQLLQQHRPQLRQVGAAALLQPQLPLQPPAMALGVRQLLHLPQPLLRLKVYIALLPVVLTQCL